MTENRAPSHFFYLFLVTLFWGSAYMFVKISLDSIPPLSIAAGRIAIAAVITSLFALKMGANLPRNLSEWRQTAIIGITGNIIPFFLINWCVQYVPSSLAAICMALLPLFTFVLSHYMTDDEKFQTSKLIGVIIGLFGVVSLFYSTLLDLNGAHMNDMAKSFLAITGLIIASFSFALSGVLIKKLNNKDPLSMAAAMLITASVIIIPLALIFDQPWTLSPSLSAVMSVVILGVFATGIAALILFHLTHIAGVNFVATSTYLIPLVGIASGYVFLHEPLKGIYFISVTLIFAGIYLVEKRKRKSLK